MNHPNPERQLYLGMRPGDLEGRPYAPFYHPHMGGLVASVREALMVGPLPAELLASGVDCGYALDLEGCLQVVVTTEMPGVTPSMLEWWFAWHSDEPQRYKLWHPQAHLHAEWHHARSVGYVGRISFVDEYIGSTLQKVAIEFVPPSSLGLSGPAICAHIHYANSPLRIGYLVHELHPNENGLLMRSRFRMGGSQAAFPGSGFAGEVAIRLLSRVVRPTLDNARELLIHTSQEMNHLASFLPALHAACT